MDERERFEYELNKRLRSEVWDAGTSSRVLKKAAAQRRIRLSVAGAVAVIAVIAVAAGFYIHPVSETKAEANTIVMQQINGTYNATVGSSSSSYSDPIDAEISDALWKR
jgi:predicted ATP-grasp superfamily ATP-dependent carboligase